MNLTHFNPSRAIHCHPLIIGATETGMIPEKLKSELKLPLLRPEVMAEPIVYLFSEQSDGITGERIVATEFFEWYASRLNGYSK